MERHPKFEHSRFVGDKRTQLVYDLDSWEDLSVIDEIAAAGPAGGAPPPRLRPPPPGRPSTAADASGLRRSTTCRG